MDSRVFVEPRILLNGGEPAQTFIEQPRSIHVFIRRQVRGEFRDPLAQLAESPEPVIATFVIKGHRKMNDGLKELLAGAAFLQPGVFKHFVAIEKPASIEARNTLFEAYLHAGVYLHGGTFARRSVWIDVLDSRIAVWNWFRRKQDSEPLVGAPAHARMKSYSAMSGYVYQYVFIGQRPATRARREGMEYAFSVSYDRKTHHRLWVFVADDAIAAWTAENGRELTNSERYGVAKIALRNAFDERTPVQIHEPIMPGADEVRQILIDLDV